MIKAKCTITGKSYSDATVKSNLSKAYKEKYAGEPEPRCAETGERAQGSSHIIAKARCKVLGLTSLIWHPDNFFPATHEVNRRWENNDKTLPNYWEYMEFVKKHDIEGYNKRIS